MLIFAAGADFSVWMKLLGENKFNVSLKKIPHVFFITFIIILFSPLAIMEKIFSWRKIRKVKLKEPPIFILGHWRQGTTLLHDLFNCNPDWAFMTLFESIFPNHFLYSSGILSKVVGSVLPETRPQDDWKINPNVPSEHDFAIANLSSMSPYVGGYFPENQEFYNKYATLEDMTDKQINKIRKSFEWVVKKLTLKKKFKRLVLKSPVDTARVKFLLESYPDAKYVHIKRNPFEVFYSTKRMHEKLITIMQLQDGYPDLDEFVLTIFEGMYKIFYEEVKLIPEGNYIEIRYEDFVANPLDTMTQIYETLSLPGYDKAKPIIEKYLENIRDYKPSSYNFPEEDVNRIYSRWHTIIEIMGYEKPKITKTK